MKKYMVGFAFAAVVVAFILYFTLIKDSEPKAKTYKIGILNYAKVAESSIDGFKEGMSEQGYKTGDNIEYFYEGPIGDKKALLKAGQKLIDQNVNLIFAPTTPAALAAKQVTEKLGIPVVIGPVSDAIGVGLVKSLNHADIPRITGVVFGLQEEKRMEWLLKLSPNTKRIYVPYNDNDQSPRNAVIKLRSVADRLNLQLIEQPIKDIGRLSHYINNPPDTVDAIYLPTDSLMASKTPEFARVAADRKLLLTCPHHPGVKQGALFSYSFKHSALGKQAARLAGQILQGMSSSDLPIEHAEFYLTINLRTAEKIGIHIPDNILRQADTIIK